LARIRTIKPEFFTSEDIVSLSPLARLLYIAIWCEADKEGRLIWKPVTFKLRYLPADNCDIKALCQELLDARLVVTYGAGLAYVPGFAKHQHVNPRESNSLLQPPPDYVPEQPKKITADVRDEVMERDGHKCVRCNATDDLTLDHILPQSIDGPHIAANLRCMCRRCNSARPVSGQGLRDDLATDGLTIDGLRAKFGLDASRRVRTRANPELHAQGGREGKGREGDSPVDDETPAGPAPLPVITIPLVDGSEFEVFPSKAAEWSAAFPGVNVPQKLAQIRVWCQANPSKRKTRRGAETFIVSWLGRDQDSGRGGGVASPQGGLNLVGAI
jgi:hypothetical protein